MTQLTKNHARFNWTPECEAAFQELKLRLTTAPMLTIIVGNQDLTVYTYASLEGVGAILMQRGK